MHRHYLLQTPIKSVGVLICLFTALNAAADVPRTSSGKPDFTGVYDTGTLTPLNRPKEFGTKKFMTKEEAQ